MLFRVEKDYPREITSPSETVQLSFETFFVQIDLLARRSNRIQSRVLSRISRSTFDQISTRNLKIFDYRGFLLLLVAIAIGATLYDLFVYQRAKERGKKEFLTFENNNTNGKRHAHRRLVLFNA